MSGPYDAQGNPGHAGLQGRAYNQGSVPGVNVPVSKVDSPGTGTFPPDQQGKVGQSQPAGLSATTQYGEPAVGSDPNDSPVNAPVSHIPEQAEGPAAAGYVEMKNDGEEDEEDEDDNG